MSLRWRLPLTYFFLITLLLGAVISALMPLLYRHLLDEKAAPLRLQGAIIANAVRGPLLNQDGEIHSIVRDYADAVGARVLVLNSQKQVKADSFLELLDATLDIPVVTQALTGTGQLVERRSGEDVALYMVTPIISNQETVGVVFLSSSMASLYETLEQLRHRVYLGMAGVAIAALVVSLYLASTITKPLTDLTQAIEKLSLQGDNRVQESGYSEMKALGRAFNIMAERLKLEDLVRKRFVSDASHELRTPLAAMKTLSETLLHIKDDQEADPEVVTEFLEDINQQVDRLARLVKDLFDIAQLDRRPQPKLAKVDLRQLAIRVARHLMPIASARGIEVEVCPQTGFVEANIDEELIYRAIFNLVDNAVKYSPDQGKVSVQVSQSQDGTNIAVTDQGPGIALDEQEKVFQRFYRVDKSRVRITGGGGLGLSLANEIVGLHGGTICLRSELDQGSTFTIYLPHKVTLSQ